MIVLSLHYAHLVKSCTDPASGKAIHTALQASGLEQDIYLRNLLVQMYGRLGCIREATALFHQAKHKNIFSWTILMTGYADNGLHRDAVALFRSMAQEGMKPDKVTFITLLKAVSRLEEALQLGRELEKMIHSLFVCDKTLVTALLNMYASWGSLPDVNRLFFYVLSDEQRDLVSWNSLLAAHARHRDGTESVTLFYRMLAEGVKPDGVTLASITGVCSRLGLLILGKTLHEQVILSSSELLRDVFLAASLVNMYTKCSSFEDAKKVFERTDTKRTLVSWNAMLAAYGRFGHPEDVFKLFSELQLEGLKPSPVTYINVLSSCCTPAQLDKVKQMELRVLNDAQCVNHVVLATALVNSFCLCGSLADAEAVFLRTTTRNTASWNAMISGYVQSEAGAAKALVSLWKMENEGAKPNSVTFLSIVEACSCLEALEPAKSLHARLSASFSLEMTTELGTALVNMYVNCGSPKDAEEVFLSLTHKDTVCWNAILSCASVNGRSAENVNGRSAENVNGPSAETFNGGLTETANCHSAETHDWYRRMELEGIKSDRNTLTIMLASSTSIQQLEELRERVRRSGYELDGVMVVSLIERYAEFGALERAQEAFNELHGEKSVTLWTSMVSACLQHEHTAERAWSLFRRMNLEGVKVNSVTILSLLSAPYCSLAQGKELHQLVLSNEVQLDELVGTSLVNLYGKHGDLENAAAAFNDVPTKNNVCWNSLLKVYAQQGRTLQVLETFKEMNVQGVEPNKETFIFVLHACSHAGNVKEACEQFSSMSLDFQLTPSIQHYVCVIDVLSRAGWVENAHELIERMPYEPNSLAWTTLLAACAQYGKISEGCVAAEQVKLLQKDEDGASYVLFSNMQLRTPEQ